MVEELPGKWRELPRPNDPQAHAQATNQPNGGVMTYPGSNTHPGLLTFPGIWSSWWPPSGVIPRSVARRPRTPVTIAPRGSVQPQVPWRPILTVDAEFEFDAELSIRAEMAVTVDAEFEFDADYTLDFVGGSISITADAAFVFDADTAYVHAFAPDSPFGFDAELDYETGPAKFLASGMNKSGNYTLPSTNTWHTIPTWVVRSGFPDTVITSNGIQVPDQAEISIAGQLTFGYQDSLSGNGMRMRVMAGSTQIGTTAATAGNGTVAALTPFTWKNETGATVLVTVQGYTTSASFSRNVVQGGVNSYLEMTPVVPVVLRASDNFDRPDGPLGSNWTTTGGGTLNIVNGHLNGVGTPSVPLSYAWWHQQMPSDTQVVRAVMRWDGYDPEHSACGLVVRANPYATPSNPGTENGVQFSWTRGIMALYYEDYDATNGYVPVTGTAQYVSTSKFPEGAVVELRAEGNLYTARVNGTIMLQGTVENSVIPFSNHYVGLTIQDDSSVSGGGGPPGRLDDFEALTP
ncbi:hypothetical protein AAI421_14385 [Rhodococcus aetherivorans]|uniref:hypothetical protein n=1 Tax=Rhodococcus aetherivorans TaxID=191292 RepID=UPI0031D232E3